MNDGSHLYLTEDVYRSAPSLSALRDIYIRQGAELNDDSWKDDVYQTALQDWWQINREPVDEDVIDIPGYDLDYRDGVISVRGVSHEDPGDQAAEEIESFVTDRVDEYRDTGLVLKEQAIMPYLPDTLEEMQDLDYAGTIIEENGYDETDTASKWYIAKLKRMMTAAGLAADSAIGDFLLQQCLDERDYTYFTEGHASRQSVDNWNDFLNIQDSYLLPLHLEREYESEHMPFMNALKSERSIYMAEQATEAIDAGEDQVYLVVGTGHAPQIRDYLDSETGVNT